MATSLPDDSRVTKLSKFFIDIIYERRKLNTPRDGKLFIEAVCMQADPLTCAHKLLSSPSGLSAIRASVMFDTSATFLNEHAVTLLQYLQKNSLKTVDSGSILAKILLTIVEPPFFWDAFTKSFKDGALIPSAVHGYAWLLLQLICLPGKASAPHSSLARSPGLLDLILKAPDGETRILGQKIKHALPLDASDLHIDADSKPGGRHDNDHADYREVSIMPTADELLSVDRPFLRTADFLENPELKLSRQALHMDNQFRLLREDMLSEIRDGMKVLRGLRPGRHRGLILENLSRHTPQTLAVGHRPSMQGGTAAPEEC